MVKLELICRSCGAPVADNSILCVCCTDLVATALGDITALVDELETTMSRQTSTGARVGSRGTETPLPFDIAAADILGALRGILVGWVLDFAESRGEALPADDLGAMSGWLLARLEHLRHHPAADEIATEIMAVVTQARRAIDRKADRWYAGPCQAEIDDHPCDAELYARPGAAVVSCPRCHTAHDVKARREHLLAAAEDQLLHAAWIAQAVTALGDHITQVQITRWVNAGRLLAHGVDLMGRATYRVGDVRQLAHEDLVRKLNRKPRKVRA